MKPKTQTTPINDACCAIYNELKQLEEQKLTASEEDQKAISFLLLTLRDSMSAGGWKSLTQMIDYLVTSKYATKKDN
jgi:hypothetical protein